MTFNHKHHLITHTGEKWRTYQCSLCGKAFAIKQDLKQHHRIHTGDKPYQYSLCDQNVSKCSCHKIGVKPYQYCLCEKVFSENGSMKIYLRTHTGEKSYQCSRCEKSFSRKQHLISHLDTHMGKEQSKCSTYYTIWGNTKSLKMHLEHHNIAIKVKRSGW